MKLNHSLLFILLVALLTNCSENESLLNEDLASANPSATKGKALQAKVAPLFENAIASTDIDFIRSTDPNSYLSLAFLGRFRREMPGLSVLIDENAFVFEASFNDFEKTEIWCHSNFQTEASAKEYAEKVAKSLGKLPFFLRNPLTRIVLHTGDGQGILESEGEFFSFFSDEIDEAEANNDLEEQVFSNAVFVAFNKRYATSTEWTSAQQQDNGFITELAETIPQSYDISETALFVYTMKYYPGRLSSDIEQWVSTNIPNRYNFLDSLFDERTNNPYPNGEPLFEFSISGTGIDYIKSTDPDTFLSISYLGRFAKEIPGIRPLVDPNAYVFEASFTGGKKIGIWCRSNFGSLERATEYANKLTDKLGKLPVFMRDALDHVSVLDGPGGASAEPAGKFFTIFSERMDLRIGDNQLEETVFHETAHVVFEIDYSNSQAWRNVQQADGVFATEYAESRPTQEDIPETSIFVYTMKYNPGRLSSNIEDWIRTNVPNRYQFLDELFDEKANGVTVGNNDQSNDGSNQGSDNINDGGANNDVGDNDTDNTDDTDENPDDDANNNGDDNNGGSGNNSTNIRDLIDELMRRLFNN